MQTPGVSGALSWKQIAVLAIVAVALTSLRFWAIHSRSVPALNVLKPLLALAQPMVLWAICAAFARDWRGIRRWPSHRWLLVALLLGYAAVNGVLHPYFDRPELRSPGLGSDVDDEFIVAAGNAWHLRSPYADPLYTGNPISEGPAWVILNAIFGSRKWFFLLAPAWATVFAAVVWRTTRAPGTAVMALSIALASTGVWESSFGGDLAAAGFAMAAATLLCLQLPRRGLVLVAATMLIGAVATVRLPFVLFPMLPGLLLARRREWRASLAVSIGGLAVAVGSHLIFWAASRGGYPPLHLVGQSIGSVGPRGLLLAAGLAGAVAVVGWRFTRDEADALSWQATGLFVPFAVVAWQIVMAVGLTGDDWTRYVAPAVPSFGAAAALAVYRAESSVRPAPAGPGDLRPRGPDPDAGRGRQPECVGGGKRGII